MTSIFSVKEQTKKARLGRKLFKETAKLPKNMREDFLCNSQNEEDSWKHNSKQRQQFSRSALYRAHVSRIILSVLSIIFILNTILRAWLAKLYRTNLT